MREVRPLLTMRRLDGRRLGLGGVFAWKRQQMDTRGSGFTRAGKHMGVGIRRSPFKHRNKVSIASWTSYSRSEQTHVCNCYSTERHIIRCPASTAFLRNKKDLVYA